MNTRAQNILLVLLTILLGACNPDTGPTDASASQAQRDTASVMVDSANYRHDRGMQYTLYDLSNGKKTAVGGSIVNPLDGGGAKGCCLALPMVWHPGIKVQVEWEESDFDKIYPEKYVKELEVPRYEKPADLYVVFYPGHEVDVVVSVGEPGHPEWAGRIKQSPWEQCVADYGRKVCLRATPKLFDTVGAQGFCVYLKEEQGPEEQYRCLRAINTCTREFEDEDYCKGILWGPRRNQEEIMGVRPK